MFGSQPTSQVKVKVCPRTGPCPVARTPHLFRRTSASLGRSSDPTCSNPSRKQRLMDSAAAADASEIPAYIECKQGKGKIMFFKPSSIKKFTIVVWLTELLVVYYSQLLSS